ncbi:MAG: hypothetical protein ABIX01_20085 [Chitinophagaceae bacterium]
MNTIISPVTKWTFAEKASFRFFFIFLGLSTWFGYNVINTIFRDGADWWVNSMSGLSKPFAWLDKHLYHFGYEPVKDGYVGITDGKVGWVLTSSLLLVAFIGTVIWCILDKRRLNYIKLHYWFRMYLVYYLFLAIMPYALFKIIPLQMPFPNAEQLLTPVGNNNGFRLVWNFMGARPGYSVFAGICEMTGCVMILFRRTRVFGCLFLCTVMVNVVCLNIFYNVFVKLQSIHLLTVIIFLLVPHIPKLVRIFYYLQPVSLAEREFTFTTRWKKWLLAALLLAPAYASFIVLKDAGIRVNNNKLFRHQEVYDVSAFTSGSDIIPPLLTDTFRIKRLVFMASQSRKVAILYNMKDIPDYYFYKWDTAGEKFSLTNVDTTKPIVFTYTEPAKNKLQITGNWKGKPVTMQLEKFEIDSMKLVKEKIKWVQ